MIKTLVDGARRACLRTLRIVGRFVVGVGGVPAILALALLALSILTGCKSADSRPTVVKLTMRASPTINRDASGRPSPVAVRVYELKSPGAMDKADFFSLLSKEQDALGADLNTRHDYMLRPGDVMTLEQTLQPDTRYVAFVAAYREIERSRWRAVHPVALHKKTALGLRVDDLDVTIGPP